MTAQNSSTVSAGNVIRWFCIDWEFFGSARAATERHEEIFELLGSMKGAVEVNSGHTGVNVAFENIRRTDHQMIEEITWRLAAVQKACRDGAFRCDRCAAEEIIGGEISTKTLEDEGWYLGPTQTLCPDHSENDPEYLVDFTRATARKLAKKGLL